MTFTLQQAMKTPKPIIKPCESEVDCPSCLAIKGEMCKTKDGYTALHPHVRRVKVHKATP